MTRVVFVLVPGVILLDLAGPSQVFASAAAIGAYDLTYVGEQPVIASSHGLVLQAQVHWPELDPDDIVIMPGWRAPLEDGSGSLSEEGLQFLRGHHASGGTVASVCSGALALGRAGLLDGRRCTTHHDIQQELGRRYPLAHVVPDVLFTEDDRVMTSAGIASGIDLALHIVASRQGAPVAAQVARNMVVYARRNGEAAQLSVLLSYRSHVDELVHRVQDHIDEQFDRALPLDRLARIAGVSPRTLTRSFTAATGLTPLRYQQMLRQEHAENLLEQGSTAEAAARAVGFGDARMLRRLRQGASFPAARPTRK
ncbi:GlxA family transcriptional regulator [Microbacterium resistens]|uniref:GlxA family transcriptional regulator n=1 Tax=Microbacterium resistens TaxID=156977 RepID=UPI000836FD3C|nr:DJ-1/PfpI family protein [Microbacterium resistens]